MSNVRFFKVRRCTKNHRKLYLACRIVPEDPKFIILHVWPLRFDIGW